MGPTKFGVLLYPGFEVLDVFGPLEALNVISRTEFGHLQTQAEINGPALTCVDNLELHVITTEKTLDPITAVAPFKKQRQDDKKTSLAGSVKQEAIVEAKEVRQIGAARWPGFVPSCTLDSVPADLEMLIIPGGLGASAVGEDVIDWIGQITPNLKYLFTVCTGSLIASRAGVLNGLRATTNKQAWGSLTDEDALKKNPKLKNVYWVADARWVKGSDKIWTTSGVSAGTDGFIAWMKEVYGQAYGEKVCQWMEYRAETEAVPVRFEAGLSDVKPAGWGGAEGKNKCACHGH